MIHRRLQPVGGQEAALSMRAWGRAAGIGALYFLASLLSRHLGVQPAHIASIWPASGIALAALLLLPQPHWPLILAAIGCSNVAVNLVTGIPLTVSLGFAAANTVESLLAVWLLVSTRLIPLRMGRLRDVLALASAAGLSAGLAGLLGAVVASLGFGLSVWPIWRMWWTADGIGILLLTPLILTVAPLKPRVRQGLSARRAAEALALALGLWLIAQALFGTPYWTLGAFVPLPYLVFPLLGWAAWRFGPPGAASALFLLAVIAVWHTVQSRGPFAAAELPAATQMLSMQLFLMLTSLSTLVMAALVAERRQAAAELTRANTTLEERSILLELAQDITRAANEAASSEAALQYAVDRICASLNWPVGHVYLATAATERRWVPTAIWHLGNPEHFAVFQQTTQTVEFAEGEGTIGRVGIMGTPEWIVDVTVELAFRRRSAALAAALKAGFAVPVLVGSEAVAVLEFYTLEPMAPNPPLLEAMRQVGTQLGRALERELAAEQAQRHQEALFQSEKLAAMGSLLSNVAHELNNPLATVLMQADLLREDSGDGPLSEYAEEIKQAAWRCERLVNQFLTLARHHTPERTQVELNQLVTETLALMAYSLRVDDIEVVWHGAADLPTLWADPHQLQQVVVNLVLNAQEAMCDQPPPRQLTLATRWEPVHDRVTLNVTDTGPGIAPAQRDRIFEPFYTTKPVGVGTGLGLPLCQGLIEGHSGTLSVVSVPERGATFRIELPVALAPAELATLPESERASPVTADKTLLIVDDEAGIMKALVRLLQRDGYTVDTAANGRQALVKLETRPYDLILSDIRMPELDGIGLYQAVECQYPELRERFIFLTGDTLSPGTQTFFEQHPLPCLTKPLTAKKIRRAIQQALQA